MKTKQVSCRKSVEHIHHFNCHYCTKWWSIGDAPEDKHEWYCPWCGEKQVLDYEEG